MSPDRWERVKELFETALERAAPDRAAYVALACEGDESLRTEVERLLADYDRAGSFLEGAPSLPCGSDDLQIGHIVSHYEIVAKLGQGGMGTVYKAVDSRLGRHVAIKILRRQSLRELDPDKRFLREARAASALNHPNVAHIYEAAEAGGVHFIAMEYIEGRTLDAAIGAGPLPLARIAELGSQAASALADAHAHGIIHRDIKPSNLIIGPRGELKILDFGLAKVATDPGGGEPRFSETRLTGPGILMGTMPYMSPEQLLGRAVDHRSDIFSLGLVLYEMAAGHAPFRGTPIETINQILNARPEPLLRWPELDRIVGKCLEKEPQRRYQTAGEIGSDLRKLQGGAGKSAWMGRLVLVTAGFLIVAVLGAPIYKSVQHAPARERGPVPAAAIPQRWDHLRIEKIAAFGEPAPGDGFFINDFEPWGINDRGDLAFAADLSTGHDGVFLLWKGTMSPVRLMRAGLPAPGGGTFEGGVLGHTVINHSGDVAFVYGLSPFNPPELEGFTKAGLYAYSHANHKLRAVVVPGVTPAPGFDVFQSTNQRASLNNSGDIAFSGVVRTTAGTSPGLGVGIFLVDHNDYFYKVAAPNDPVTGGHVFDYAMNPWINDKRDIAFGAHVAGEECIGIVGFGPACGESIYRKRGAAPAVESIAHQGDPAPGGGRYRSAWGPVLNDRGDIVFMGDLTPRPDFQRVAGIFLYSGVGTVAIARPGDAMPGGGKIRTVNPTNLTGNFSLNNRGDVSFNAVLDNGETGLFVHSQGSLHVVARTGTMIPGIGRIASVTGLVNGGTLNDSGQVFFWVTLTDGSGVLLLATP